MLAQVSIISRSTTSSLISLSSYGSGEYCEKALPRALQWQYDAFCADSPQFLAEFNPPFYELNPDTHRPFANLLRMRSAKVGSNTFSRTEKGSSRAAFRRAL